MLLATIGNASRGAEHGPRFLFPLVLLLLLGFFVGKIIRHRRGGGSQGQRHGAPMQILENRFARGEIDRAEFDHRKAVLAGSDTVPPAPARSAPPADTQAAEPPTDTQESPAPEADSPDLEDEE